MQPLLTFLQDNIPTPRALALGGPLGLLWAYLSLAFAGYLKQKKHWKTGYTRKVFHFLTFLTVAACLLIPGWGMPIVCLYAGMASLVILYAIVKGPGHPLYEAMAREKDEPHRTAYIITPYLATLSGGLITSVFFGPLALVGFLVTGIADAVAEPVGTRYGRHPYRVLTATRTKSYRTLEGSLAVFIASCVCIFAAAAISPAIVSSPQIYYIAPLIALICALVEAISPHGWDNFTMQFIPVILCAWWM